MLGLIGLGFALQTATAQVGALRRGQPSPTAASLGKFGDVPVSLHTGTPQIGVPLQTIEGVNAKLPMRLSYHASGHTVRKIPGWVGLGWALEAGGVITRTTRGLPDDGKNGYIKTGKELGYHWDTFKYQSSVADTSDADDYLDAVKREFADPEPDAFFFNVAGRSGKFVIDQDGEPHVVTGEPLEITYRSRTEIRNVGRPATKSLASDGRAIPSWTITTENGTSYTFSAIEYSYRGPTEIKGGGYDDCREGGALDEGCAWVSAWYLTKVRSPRGETMTLTYGHQKNVERPQPKYAEQTVPTLGCGSAVSGYDLSGLGKERWTQTTPSSDQIYLKTIETNRQRVRFESSLRGDKYMVPNERKLDAIVVEEKDGGVYQPVLRYRFSYRARGAGRLFLDRVNKVGANGTSSRPPYRFTYKHPTLPPRLSNNVDHWGHYNEAGSNSRLPAVTVLNPWNQIEESYFDETIALPGAHRGLDEERVKAGLLTRIRYPTGGTAEFSYEPHDYSRVLVAGDSIEQYPNYDRKNERLGLGLRLPTGTKEKEIQLKSHDGSDVLVDVSASVSSMEKGATCTDQAPDTYEDADEYVTLSPKGENPVWFFYCGWEGQSQIDETITLSPGTYVFRVHKPVDNDRTITGSVDWINSTKSKIQQGGGVRIRKIKTKGGAASEPTVKTFDYRDPNNPSYSSGYVVRYPRDYYFGHESYVKKTTDLNGNVSISYRNCHYIERSSRPVAGLGSTQGGPVGYDYVTVRKGKNGEQGRTVHAFRNLRPPSLSLDRGQDLPFSSLKGTWPFSSWTSYSHRHGFERRRSVFTAGNDVMKRVERTRLPSPVEDPTSNPTSTQHAIPALSAKFWTRDISGNKVDLKMRAWKPYFRIAEWIRPRSKTVTRYDPSTGDSTWTKTTKYFQDSGHRQVTRIVEESSEGLRRTTSFKYAAEHYSEMENAHMYSQKYRTTVFRDLDGNGRPDGSEPVWKRRWTEWMLNSQNQWTPKAKWEWTGPIDL